MGTMHTIISATLNTIYQQAGSVASSTHFLFEVADQPKDTFKVIHWQGSEAISGNYRYTLSLSASGAVDETTILGKNATLCIGRDGDMRPIHGHVSEICHLGALATDHAEEYQVVIESPLAKLHLIRHSRVFLNLDLKGVIEQILLTAGFTADSFSIVLKTAYPVREYIAQYNETDFDFFQRLLVHAGVFYSFVQQEEQALLVIRDDSTGLTPLAGSVALIYMPASGQIEGEETVHLMQKAEHYFPPHEKRPDHSTRNSANTFIIQDPTPGKLTCADNNDDDYWSATMRTEAGYLVLRRQQAIDCQRTLYKAETNCRGIAAGSTLTVSGNPYKDSNGDFLVVAVLQQSGQAQTFVFAGSFITASCIAPPPAKDRQKSKPYHNELLLIKKDTPYRPPLDLVHSLYISGVIAARIVTTGGECAYLDDYGRIRLRMPFDATNTRAGADSQATGMQALAGIPPLLRAGDLVHLSSVDGDPNWPVIWT
jgi:type VI secretion system secreted protein VgrG